MRSGAESMMICVVRTKTACTYTMQYKHSSFKANFGRYCTLLITDRRPLLDEYGIRETTLNLTLTCTTINMPTGNNIYILSKANFDIDSENQRYVQYEKMAVW